MAEYRLFVRDAAMARVAEITDWQKLQVVLRYNAPGSWLLELPRVVVARRVTITPDPGIAKESFDKADAETLGPDLTWDESVGTDAWDVSGSRGRYEANGTGRSGIARADVDLGFADVYAQVLADVSAGESTRWAGLITRKDGSGTSTYYRFTLDWQADQARIERVVGGAATVIAGPTAITLTPGTPVLLRAESQGSAHRLYVDGNLLLTVTDATITTGQYAGLYANNNNFHAFFDSFEAFNLIDPPNIVTAQTVEDTAVSDALLADGAGLELVRDGVGLLSGPIDMEDLTWEEGGEALELAGPDDMIRLRDYLALPVPLGPPYTSQAYDVRTGVAETIMRAYVDNNLGPSARSDRKIPGFTLAADQARGKTLTGRARFQPVYDLLLELALADGTLGFRVVPSGSGLQFQVYQPADKSSTVVFAADLGNLIAYQRRKEIPEANFGIVGGSGEGTSRVFAEGGDSASIVAWRRREIFIDQREATAAGELTQERDARLAEMASRQGVVLTPLEDAPFAFGADYGLGDKIKVVAGEEVFTEVVREVVIDVTSGEGETVIPVVGTPEFTPAVAIVEEHVEVEGPEPPPTIREQLLARAEELGVTPGELGQFGRKKKRKKAKIADSKGAKRKKDSDRKTKDLERR